MLILQTPRLLLREFTLADAAFIVELLNTPGWLANIGDRNVKTIADAETYLLNGPVHAYQTLGFGLWAVADKATGQLIGMCGLLQRDTLECPDIGYALLPAFTGMGYAFEITAAVLQYGFDVCRMTRIAAITLPTNAPSVKLLQKLGMRFEKNIPPVSGNQDLMMFSATK